MHSFSFVNDIRLAKEAEDLASAVEEHFDTLRSNTARRTSRLEGFVFELVARNRNVVYRIQTKEELVR